MDDVPAAAAAVGGMTALKPYKGQDSEFTAMGDEYGLLLIMKRGRVVDFTGNSAHGVRVYDTGVTVRGVKTASHRLPGLPYRVTIEERCSCA